MQAKSDSAMSISEGKAKGVPMTPTAQSALRALVAQWKQEAVIEDATCNDTIAVQLRDCADALERLLESEQ